MGLGRRIRNIARSQIKAIKERLDRIDMEAEELASQKRFERDARSELEDPTDIRPPLRTPEEIASGVTRPLNPAPSHASTSAPSPTAPTTAGTLHLHYKVLGLEDGADFSAVEAAYSKLAARCAPDRFPAGSEEQKTVLEIRKRVDVAFEALRDVLDSTAGRFDKLEL